MADKNQDILPASQNTENFISDVGSWISGIPKIFQKPLAKAFGRLIYGLVDIPASKLEAISSDIKNQQSTKEKMRSALAKSAISQISENPEITERALDYFSAQVIGAQKNRESVFNHAAELLAQDSQNSSDHQSGSEEVSQDLDDDWINEFSYRAERASTERMQQLFGRVLAGEIKRPGSFSLFTIDFLCKISQKEASIITSISPFVVGNTIPLTPHSRNFFTFEICSILGSLGIFTPTSIGVTNAQNQIAMKRDVVVSGRFGGILSVDPGKILVVASDEQKTISYECHVLTHLGKEILSLHYSDLDGKMLGELSAHLKNQGTDLFLVPARQLIAGLQLFPISPI